ncbi:MAG: hypothetical protein IKY71_03745 [Bacteroidaceae bacterium]|nr:hypothetical protein [Bacteroidaceae bacterium]
MFTTNAIVRPLTTADSEYSVCGYSVLRKAKVVKTFATNLKGNNMQIEVLDHVNPAVIGKKYKVNSRYFEEINPEWIWVDAYKGTDANMQCKGKQYTMNVEHTYPGTIALGTKGYHVCTDIKDCFKTYDYNFQNRFFKVKALVSANAYAHRNPNNTTLVAKAVKFVDEVTYDPETIAAKRTSL